MTKVGEAIVGRSTIPLEEGGVPSEITARCLILGEGADEKNFFEKYLKFLGLENVHIESYDGKDNLLNHLVEVKKRPGFRNLEIVLIFRDADNSAKRAFQSVKGFLKKSGFVVPKEMGMVAAGEPSVAVYIFPDNDTDGAIEDLFLRSIQDDSRYECTAHYLNCLKRKGIELNRESKSAVQAYLAGKTIQNSKDRIVSSVGLAAQNNQWDFRDKSLHILKNFILDLLK